MRGDRHGDRQADKHEDSGDAQRVQETVVVEQGDVLVQSDEVDVERGAKVLGGDVGEGHRHRGQEGNQHEYAEHDCERQGKSPCENRTAAAEDVARALRLRLSCSEAHGISSRFRWSRLRTAGSSALVDGDLSLVHLLEDTIRGGGYLGQVDSAGGAMVFFSWSPNAASLSLPESASSSHAF